MKKFLAIYTASPTSPSVKAWEALDAETKNKRTQAGKAGWSQWVSNHTTQITDTGSPVGKTKQVNAEGISDIKNKITAYTVVHAESHEAAAQLFLNHPHFKIFPGDAVEIMECLPIPEM